MTMFLSYTTELRTVFENIPAPDGTMLRTNKEVIENGRKVLFDFDYPMFDEKYRNVFETHFIRRFYMREIGFETFGLFKFHLETWLIINMPYFNKLFESELIKYNPLENSSNQSVYTKRIDKTQNDERKTDNHLTVEGDNRTNYNKNSTIDNSQKSTTSGQNESNQMKSDDAKVSDSNFNRKLGSDTPDGRLNISAKDGTGIIDYASNIEEINETNSKTSAINSSQSSSDIGSAKTDGESKTTTTDGGFDEMKTDMTQSDNKNETATSTIIDLEDYTQNRYGKVGVQSYAKLIMDFREALLRLENQIFDEMNELFMLVY